VEEKQELTNALSIDVEDYFQVEAFARTLSPQSWETLPHRVVTNTEKILLILEGYKVKATFFCLGWVAKRYPGLIKEIAQKGHEIASHGLSHRPLFRLSPQEFRKEARESKKILEDISGKGVYGFRAPTYSITPQTRWGLEILAEEGYTYDSSIFPIRHDLYGFLGAPRFPCVLQLKKANRSLIEFPITTFRLGPFNIPIAGGGYFRLFPYPLTRALLKHINHQENQPFVFYIHPWEMDPDQPRIKNIPLKSRFRHYLNLTKTQHRFNKLLSDFHFAPVNEVLNKLNNLPTWEVG